jgi:cytochrome c biogenesis protein CcmG/thiol:disulfide interchange protein DsbE
MRRRLILWVPLGAFLLFLAVVAAGLYAPRQESVPSNMIGQPVPDFALQAATPGRPGLSSAELRAGQAHLVNVFASWCIPCRTESAQLAELARRGIPVDGIDVRDRPEDIAAFLVTYGNPFRAIGADVDRRVQLDIGSAGLPETFVVDRRGIIRYQHIGEITPADIPDLVAAYQEAAQ